MQQQLHLLVIDPRHVAALAVCYGSRWLLPVLRCDERGRAGIVAARWAAQQQIPCEIAGQWLGRVRPDAMDWLITMPVRPSACIGNSELCWIPLGTISSSTPLLDYQGWAVNRACQSGALPSVGGPFGHLDWIDEVRAWIEASAGASCGALTAHRVMSREVTLGADTCRGTVYFKGLSGERALEASLTTTLAAIAPTAFARTLAVEQRSDAVWWLTAGLPGATCGDRTAVARELARIQRRLMASGFVVRKLPDLDIERSIAWASELVDDGPAVVIRECARIVANADVPGSWIPMDLDPTNVLVDEDGEVRFIDLDESYFGPAPLAIAVFAKRCRDKSLYRVYEQAWSPSLADVDWRAFEVVAAVFEAWRGWQRVELNTRRGEVHGALELAARRIRERLTAVVHRR